MHPVDILLSNNNPKGVYLMKNTWFNIFSAIIFLVFFSSCAGRTATFEYDDITLGITINDTPEYIELVTQEDTDSSGLVFYPGGFVDAKAYVKMLAPIADRGYRVVIFKMPFNLAVFDSSKALNYLESFKGTHNWVISGHSLGGAMAGSLVNKNPGIFKGIIFLASYPPESDSLVDSVIPMLSIYGTKDGLATPEKVKKFAQFLPAHTVYFPIEGGNHAQFGSYGLQDGDGEAKISEKEQHSIISKEIIGFLNKVFEN